MSYFRRIPVAAAAVALVLAACAGDQTATQPEIPLGSGVDGPLVFTMSTHHLVIFRETGAPAPTDPINLEVGGLIAIGGYPQFGTPNYGSGPTDWFTMTTTPDFSRDPLAWNFGFSLTATGAELAEGIYTATVPVNVAAASNSPDSLTVTYVYCDHCLVLGSVRDGALNSATSPTFDPAFPNPSFAASGPGVGAKMFEEWRLFVMPDQTVYINNRGEAGNFGTLHDPYLYSWAYPGVSFYGNDDDNCGVLNSELRVRNLGPVMQEYRIYASHFGAYKEGTYQISVNDATEDCSKYNILIPLRMDGSATALPQSWQQAFNTKHGITN